MNPWTFVITVVDPTGSSLAITPPTADLEFGAMQRYPVLNLSRALGLEQRSPLVSRVRVRVRLRVRVRVRLRVRFRVGLG